MVFAVALSGCNISPDVGDIDFSDFGDNALVGIWNTTEIEEGIDYNITVTFHVNHSGNLTSVSTLDGVTKTETDDFFWNTSGNELTMISNDGSDDEPDVSTYLISYNKLTVTFDTGDVFVFTKQ